VDALKRHERVIAFDLVIIIIIYQASGLKIWSRLAQRAKLQMLHLID